jgi:pyridoxamine 5'-phosphate oxidase
VTADPFELFAHWFAQAREHEPADADAVAVATVDARGRPSLRMVLMRAYDERGFVFYTNQVSRKVQDLNANSYCALCFHWKSTERQIRIEGSAEQVSDAEADAYFATRPRESQIGAWASKQSQILESRAVLEQRVVRYTRQFADTVIPRPEFWTGYRLVPEKFEFWDKRPFRLHDRMSYSRTGDNWHMQRLYP